MKLSKYMDRNWKNGSLIYLYCQWRR